MTEKELYAPRLHNIEFLRILFTFCIFIHHALNSFYHANNGFFAVEFFFILSGFFLYYTIDNQKNVQTFMLKKIIRFLPLMLFGQVVCDIIQLKFHFQNYISLIFFLPTTGVTDSNYYSIGGVWYVSILLWVSVFYFCLSRMQSKLSGNILSGSTIFVSIIGFNYFSHYFKIWLFPNSLLRGLVCIGIGYFLALICKENNLLPPPTNKKQNQKQCVKWIFTGLEVWLMIYILLTMFDAYIFNIDYIHRIILFLILITLFLIKKGFISQFFDDASCMKISRYCLSFFLTHQIVTNYLYRKIEFMHNCSSYSAFIMLFFASVLLAVFAYHFVEQPAYRYLKRFIDDRK